MRFQSDVGPSGRAFAVSGTNTISFAISASESVRKDLLGFAVERLDPAGDEQYFMPGFKVFPSVVPNPGPATLPTTFEHPVQSFVWDDFTARAGRTYEYRFHPLRGRPKKLDRSAEPISLKVASEPLVGGAHDVYFNRGVASSQAYQRRFGETPISKLKPAARDEALAWLGRDLGPALLRFVERCEPGDALRCCFYEIRHRPVAEALKAAIDRGVDVVVIVDAKVNEHTDPDGTPHESFPRLENLALLRSVGIPAGRVRRRESRSSAIQHNKFMVRTPKGSPPTEVWTGSTNLSLGGIAGQTNVGHWVRDGGVADRFQAYWDLLATDPGARDGSSPAERRAQNRAFEVEVERLSPVPDDLRDCPPGATVIFSPRQGKGVLESYVRLFDSAARHGCITLAFGITAQFKHLLRDNTPQDAVLFMLLEKKDVPNKRSKLPFVAINASNNVYKAWGSFLADPVYQWVNETNAKRLGLNQHVSYVHSKFMLVDPLGADPLVLSGSANFSEASVNDNDENMLVIRGDRRVADIYFSEFNRLFGHYYFRSVFEERNKRRPNDTGGLFLGEDDSWQLLYAPGKLKAKRLAVYTGMEGFTTLP